MWPLSISSEGVDGIDRHWYNDYLDDYINQVSLVKDESICEDEICDGGHG